ncbi:MAG: AarF/ABC1/UbiB kinase family protein, partial [Bacteroidetes bacterium]
MSIGTAIANIQRTAHIINTFAKYGLQDFFSSNKLIERIPALQSLLPQKVVSGQKLSRPERLRLVFEELGPTFIKFGQILSNRPDLLPESYIRELEKLQDNVPPFSSKEVIGIIEKSTGRKIDELFSAFDKQPLASASIGQVHKAVLKNGEKVAVKVRRPNIEQIIRNDIEILKFLSEFIENGFEELKRFQITEAIQEFEKVIFKELNFTYEKAAIRRFRKFFSGSKNVIIPAVFSEYSSNRVLVLEYIQGVKLSKIHQDNAINKKNTADLLVDTYFTQIFEYKSFHADPHPGNIFIVNKSKLALIDFGQVGYVLEEDIQNFGKLIVAIYDQDVTSVIRIIKKYSRTAVKNENDLKYEVNEIINDYYYRELNEIDLETVISRFRTLVFKYNITLPSNLFLL